MELNKQETKKYMNIFMGGMILTSLITAWIMAKNLQLDESKERFKLTKDYKRIKKEDYTYKPESGKQLYNTLCSKCHLSSGLGTVQTPPLVGSLIAINRPELFLKIIVKGLNGKIERNGRHYNSVMPQFKAIGHYDLAHIANYIILDLNKKKDAEVHPVEVVKAKVDTLKIKGALKPSDLQASKLKP